METVLIPNRLIEASQNLSLMGLRLRTLALTKVSLIHYVTGIAPPISISVQEWIYLFPGSEQPYRDLTRGLESLLSAKVQFPGQEKEIGFLENGKYIESEGRVEICFSGEFLKGCL